MEVEVGMMVRSMSGHDKNSFYIIVGHVGNRLLIADGKTRKIEKPKQKNIHHLQKTTVKFSIEKTTTNKQLKKHLFNYNCKSVSLSHHKGEVFSCQNKML